VTVTVRALLVAASAFICWGVAYSQAYHEPPFTPEKNVYARRLVSEPVQVVHALRDIDKGVLAVFFRIAPRREMAFGDELFDEMDTSNGGRERKFDFAVHNGDLWFIAYEIGGRAYHHCVIVFQRRGGKWQRVEAAIGFPDGDNFRSFVKAVKKGNYELVSKDPRYFGEL
jgi:hypothetical protein